MSNSFLRLNQLTLFFIYLVVIAGSLVRITGSGMGCPDWPRCFGQWIPPTEAKQLPENYREIYGEKRVKKVEKFARLLTVFGMGETAEKIKNDPTTYEELPFNAGKTWMEYVNRLAGFLAGNGVLIITLWTWFRYRKMKKVKLLTTINLVVLTFQAWFGSIVVATNLVPWTITVHLFLALVIIGLQITIIHEIKKERLNKDKNVIPFNAGEIWMSWLIFCVTTVQLFLGTQVREYVDALTKQGITPEHWEDHFDLTFFIHRSFSWAVLVLMTYMMYINFKGTKNRTITIMYVILAIELFSGVALAWAGMPGMVRVAHLLFASVLFGLLFYQLLGIGRRKLAFVK